MVTEPLVEGANEGLAGAAECVGECDGPLTGLGIVC